jgi:hypothetical protein
VKSAQAQGNQHGSQSLDGTRWNIAHSRLRALCVENLAHAPVSAEQLQKVWSAYSQELQELDG